MNNEHNPLSVRIRTLQELWLKQSLNYRDARIFVLNYKQEDNILVEGFVGVESTEYGLSNDIFLVFRTRLEEQGQLLHSLISQWLDAFEQDLKKYPDWDWTEFESFREEFVLIGGQDTPRLFELYNRILASFFQFTGGGDKRLVIVLILEYIKSVSILEEVITEFSLSLPEYVAILFPEIRGQEVYSPIVTSLKEKGCILTLPEQNTAAIYKDIATQGDPNDPQVQYRRLLFELGEKTSQKKKGEIKHIGETKFIPLCRSMSDVQVWSSAYLILAGFMMNFKEEAEYTLQLLNRGLSILKEETTDPIAYSDLTIQFYSYQAATYSMHDKPREATSAFLQALNVAQQTENKSQIVNCYNNILFVVLKQERRYYEDILKEAFEYAYAITEDDLRLVNISFIVSAYLSKIGGITSQDRQAISSRMKHLYGDYWGESPKEAIRRIESAQHIPN